MSLTLAPRPAWYDNAACRDLGPDGFYTDDLGRGYAASQRIRHAKAICAQCPVRGDCLADNINEPYGIWGGTTPLERRHMRNERAQPLPPPRPDVCGTPPGYNRHRRAGEPACEECLRAHALDQSARKNGGTIPDKPAVVNHPEMIGPAARWASAEPSPAELQQARWQRARANRRLKAVS